MSAAVNINRGTPNNRRSEVDRTAPSVVKKSTNVSNLKPICILGDIVKLKNTKIAALTSSTELSLQKVKKEEIFTIKLSHIFFKIN